MSDKILDERYLDYLDTPNDVVVGSGAGAFLSSSIVQAILGLAQYTNVKSFGVVGNGIVDDTTKFNLATAGGGLIYVPEGTYLINADNPSNIATGGIVLPSNTFLWLHPKAILKAKTSSSQRYNIIRIEESENITIRGGQILGERDTHSGTGGEWGYGIDVRGGLNVKIMETVIKNCWGDGIGLSIGRVTSRNCQYIMIHNNRIDNCRRQGISAINTIDTIISSNVITNINGTAPQSGIDIEPNPSNPAISNIVVSDNVITGCVGPGIQVYGVASSYLVSDVIIKGNMIRNNLRGIHAMYSKRVSICNNIISSNTNAGILTEYLLDSSIANNDISNNIAAGIYLDHSDTNSVTDNLMVSNHEQGLYVNNSKYNHVIGNTVKDNYLHGIAVVNALSDGNSVLNNKCIGNSFNANLSNENIKIYSGAVNTVIMGNSCKQGSNANKPATGILIQDGATTGTLVTGNDCFDGGATYGIKQTNATANFGSGNKNKDGTFGTTPN